MKLKPEDLEKEGYVLLSSLHHDELIPFLKESFDTRSTVIKRYHLFLVILLLVLVLMFFFDIEGSGKAIWSDRLLFISAGVLASLLIIPVHELLHAWAYKYLGASSTSFDANWKKLYFMAMADQFVVNYREFRIVALTPLVVISVICLILLLLPIGIWKFSVMVFFLLHSTFCSGDIALLNYFEAHQENGMVTYDDKQARMSYFYEKTQSEKEG